MSVADSRVGTAPALTGPQIAERLDAVLAELSRAVIGKSDVLRLVLTGVLAGGHLLLEDLPGLGKTLIARSLATVTGLDFTRIQFTPDLLPADLLGATVYDQRTGDLTFRPGPVFTQVLLADEINRTPPKTQAALLEAMAENQVSVDGTARPLPDPFLVLATDNPIEYEGTYPLPEAQLDRFLLRVRIGYLAPPQEADLLVARLARDTPEVTLDPVLDAATLRGMRAAVERVEVSRDLVDYIVALVDATRAHPSVQVGASPRGCLALLAASRAAALLAGRDYVLPDDIKALAVPALAHRIGLRPEMWARRIGGAEVLAEIVGRVPVPRLDRAG
ncbi:putative methanol dehydrogenase transcriptional regulatory protein MoxR3 [Actinocatenispora thailandica]|uniref:Putative methanol dehydrogenase transcriptional regulatory protein MoxR3 n=1 Tax=Actinocatenispora thailandica TaxID=227318 RepID=A0A7R7DM93_9ACTN|nr:putative methanol dehydrogenase transcriptional regulatory protein MoxR3 [Actinocatenispora thailandica]